MKKIIFFCCALIPFIHQAQDAGMDMLVSAYGITARPLDGRIIVRWAPATFSAWMLANKTGYVLERAVTDLHPGDENVDRQLEFIRLPGFPKIPYTLGEWKTKTDTTDPFVANAAHALLKPSITEGSLGMDLLYKLNSQQETRHALAMLAADLHAQAAAGLALRYEDTDVQQGRYYTYRIYNMPGRKSILTDTAYVVVRAGDMATPVPVRGVYVENGHNLVNVYWNLPINTPYFTGYHVERSENGRSFQRLTSHPVVCSQGAGETADCIYRDTMVINFKKYQYRITGIDPFAMEGLPSEVVDAEPVDQLAPPPAENITVTDVRDGFEITWEGDHGSADHDGWYIGRAVQATGPFILLHEKPLAKTVRSYTDNQAVPLVTNYYVVYSTDIHGNKNISGVSAGVRSDSIPPAKPANLNGVIDSQGVVTLYWDLGNEADLMGYRVFRANAKDREFYQLTTAGYLAGDNSFTDVIPLNTLSEEVYYTIVALDFHYNPSLYSDVLTLNIPDTIAPAKALITRYAISDKGVTLHWAPSSSDDVVLHRLWRRSDNGWEVIHTVDHAGIVSWPDENIQWNESYTYAIEAIDDAGLSSGRSEALVIQTPVRPPASKVANISGYFDAETKTYHIEWQYEGPQPVKFMVYRGIDNEPLEWYGEAGPSDRKFTDPRFYKTETGYTYAVSALFPDGTSTPIDTPYVVNVKR